MVNQHLALLEHINGSHPLDGVLDRSFLEGHLRERCSAVGEAAFAEFAYVQTVAAGIWGAEATAHFARVLRDVRVSPKRSDGCRWDKVEKLVKKLPPEWQSDFLYQIKASRAGRAVLGQTIWSTEYSTTVIRALIKWLKYCLQNRITRLPTAMSLQQYANSLVQPTGQEKPVSAATAANYLQRIIAGLDMVKDGNASTGASRYVLRDWRQRGERGGAWTKTGNQLIGARVLYEYGFDQIETARKRPVRGIRAATIFRNGLLFAVGMALPERARALTWLEFDRTLCLIDRKFLHIELPGAALKLPEARKATEKYDIIFENSRLAEALQEYRKDFRPLFDDGNSLFPSVHGKTGSVSSRQLGRLAGEITEREFGVRVPIHRFRDNVATEASENLLGGAYAAKTLLRHVDERTTTKHYDHSEGVKAAKEFGNCIDARCTVQACLLL